MYYICIRRKPEHAAPSMGIAHWRLWDHFLQSITAKTTPIGYIEISETDCAVRRVSYDPMHAANSVMLLTWVFLNIPGGDRSGSVLDRLRVVYTMQDIDTQYKSPF